jgi:hypothetical protein
MSIFALRQSYHQRICQEIIRISKHGNTEYPNFADVGNRASVNIAWGIVRKIECLQNRELLQGQTTGGRFETITQDFLEQAFGLLSHIRPGNWVYSVQSAISGFDQYEHLADLQEIVKRTDALASALGFDYIIKPDIVIGRKPLSDLEINRTQTVVEVKEGIARLTPLRSANKEIPRPILHASISCKWTLRSDRSQNARTEALNLIRNRKGSLPHIVAVTAEPLPTRLAALALGTGDLDCVYHFALPELQQALQEADNEDQLDMLDTLVSGRRLRDISDLPFDLAV